MYFFYGGQKSRSLYRAVVAFLITFFSIVIFPIIEYFVQKRFISNKQVISSIRLEEISLLKKPEPVKKKPMRSSPSKSQRPTASKLASDSSRFKMEFSTGDGTGVGIAQGKIEGMVYKAGEVDKDALIRSSILPKYPEAAQSAGISGYVSIIVVIDEKGDVINVSVEKATQGYGFQEACVEAVEQWKFVPASNKGVPVKFQLRIPFRF